MHQVIGHLIASDGPAFRERVTAIAGGATAIAPFEPAPGVEERDVDSLALDELIEELVQQRRAAVDT